MRGLFVGIVIVPVAVIFLLSLRPGGLRVQLRNAARRLRLALTLVGIFLVANLVLKLLVTRDVLYEELTGGLGIVLGIVFLVLAQDPPAERRA